METKSNPISLSSYNQN